MKRGKLTFFKTFKLSSFISLKKYFRKLSHIIILLPSVLLLLGCFYNYISYDFLSFSFSITIPILLVFNVIIGIYWLIKKDKYYLFSLFCLIIYFLSFNSFIKIIPFNFLIDSKVQITNDTLSLLTFNVNGFDDRKNESIDEDLLSFVKKNNPDVFCIQEFSAIKYKLFVRDYPHFYKTNIFTKGKSVMAVFSKYPIVNKGYINFIDSHNGAMYVDLNVNDKKIRIYNLHLESFQINSFSQVYSKYRLLKIIKSINKAEQKRREQAIKIKNHINNYNGEVIVCGDFNSTQFSTTYRVLKESKKDSFNEAGFGLGTTYKLRKLPFRIDYVLTDDNIKILSHQNFDLKLSDHEPVLVKMKLN